MNLHLRRRASPKGLVVFSCALLLAQGSAFGALHDRGNGLIYDDVLNVTWLQDANIAATQRIRPPLNSNFPPSNLTANGAGSYYSAQVFIDAMNAYEGTGYLGFNDWRLPRWGGGGATAGIGILPVLDGINFALPPYPPNHFGPECQSLTFESCGWSFGGGPTGWNAFQPNESVQRPGAQLAELAFMFHVNLGNTSYFDENANPRQGPWGLQNTGMFNNIQADNYWYDCHPDADAFACESGRYFPAFDMFDGRGQGNVYYGAAKFIWPVRDGDVIPVPEPQTWAMLGAGMVLLLARSQSLFRRPRRRHAG